MQILWVETYREEFQGDSDVGDIVMMVGDFMMVTDWRCWWQNHYVGDFFRYVGDFFQCIKSVINILNLSPTHFVSNIRRQHRCHPEDVIWSVSICCNSCDMSFWNSYLSVIIVVIICWLIPNIQRTGHSESFSINISVIFS